MNPPPCECNAHHTAISVRDLDESLSFYGRFGFVEKYRWTAEDQSLTIVHLKLGEVFLEIFAYETNRGVATEFEVGNDLEVIGVKHLGVQVRDLALARTQLENSGDLIITETKRGRTEIDYFFVRDPNGIWFEVVQDDRSL